MISSLFISSQLKLKHKHVLCGMAYVIVLLEERPFLTIDIVNVKSVSSSCQNSQQFKIIALPMKDFPLPFSKIFYMHTTYS